MKNICKFILIYKCIYFYNLALNSKFQLVNNKFRIMKNLFIALCFAFPMLAFTVAGQSAITSAIGSGDIETLSTYFDETVEICILDLEDLLDKDEAKDQIASFFEEHQPKSFNLVHDGTSKGKDSRYFIGDLKTSEEIFRVYVYLMSSSDNYLIQEIRFEKK